MMTRCSRALTLLSLSPDAIEDIGIHHLPRMCASAFRADRLRWIHSGKRVQCRRRTLERDLLVDALGERPRRIVSLQLHQMIARCDLDEECQVTARRNRKTDVRLRHSE